MALKTLFGIEKSELFGTVLKIETLQSFPQNIINEGSKKSSSELPNKVSCDIKKVSSTRLLSGMFLLCLLEIIINDSLKLFQQFT
jgi:hypothetical protein